MLGLGLGLRLGLSLWLELGLVIVWARVRLWIGPGLAQVYD